MPLKMVYNNSMQYYLRKLTIYEYDPPCLIQRSGNCTSYYKSKKASVYYDWHILLAIHVPTYMVFPYAPLSAIDALYETIPTAITINTNLHLISFDCIKLAFAVNIVFVPRTGLEPAQPTG